MTKSRGLGHALRNPRVSCPECGREMTNNLIGRHVRTHDPEYREALRVKRNAKQSAYNQTPEGRATARRSRHSERGRKAHHVRILRWRRTPEGGAAHQAHNAVRAALRTGRLVKQACVVCGDSRSFAHHPNGYVGAARLDVQWLCQTHHMEVHGRVAA